RAPHEPAGRGERGRGTHPRRARPVVRGVHRRALAERVVRRFRPAHGFPRGGRLMTTHAALKGAFPSCDGTEGFALDEEASRQATLECCNRKLESLNAAQRVEWALKNLPARHILSSSFGAQAAVALHLVTRAKPDIPVVLIDTGYLFPETYRFVDELTA